MITTSQKPSYQYLRKLMVFPVAAIVIGLFAFSYKKKNDDNLTIENFNISGKVPIIDTAKKPYTDTIVLNKTFASPKRKSPTEEQLKTWSNKEIYGVWLDGRRISNNELTNHQPSEFILYNVSKLEKNALNYGKHYYQVNLSTENYYKKSFPDDSFTVHMIHIVKDTVRPVTYENNKIFDKVEIEPSFPGGEAKWRQYLERNLDASVPVKKKAPDGAYTVVIQFVVNKEGNISDVRALTNHGYGMENEALRVIKAGPRWVPAIQNGRLVKAYKRQLITFIIGKGEKNFPSTVKTTGNELNEIVVTSLSPQKTDDNIFDKEETPPTFPGGDSAWRRYLERTLNASVPVDSGAPAGIYKIIVQFIVHEDGFISDIKAKTNFGYGMENEVMRVIKAGPKWIPARQNGHVVRAYTLQPVTFVITEEVDNPITIENNTILKTNENKKLAIDPLTLYIGVENFITVACSGVSKEDLIVSVSQGNITGENGKYYIRVFAVSDAIILQVSTKDGSDLGKQVFKARLLPNPDSLK